MKLLEKYGWNGTGLLIGLEIDETNGVFKAIQIRKQKDEVQLLNHLQFENIQYMIAWAAEFKEIPIVLDLKLEGRVSNWVVPEKGDLIHQVLGVRVSGHQSFGKQLIPGKGKAQFATVVRKEEVGQVLGKIRKLRERVIYLNLSPASCYFLLPALQAYSPQSSYKLEGVERPLTWKHGLAQDQEGIQSVSLLQMARDCKVPVEYLGLYAACCQYYLFDGQDILSFQDIFNQSQNWKKANQLLKIGLTAFATIILLMSLSIIGTNIVSLLNSNLEKEFASSKHILTQIEQQAADIDERNQVLAELGKEKFSQSALSKYLAEMASNTPRGLHWEKYYYQPPVSIKKKVDYELADRKLDILLVGWSKESIDAMIFSERLQQLAFVRTAVMYDRDYDYLSGRHRFILCIQLEHA